MKIKVAQGKFLRVSANENHTFRFTLANGATIENVRMFVVQGDDAPIVYTGNNDVADGSEIYRYEVKTIEEVAA